MTLNVSIRPDGAILVEVRPHHAVNVEIARQQSMLSPRDLTKAEKAAEALLAEAGVERYRPVYPETF